MNKDDAIKWILEVSIPDILGNTYTKELAVKLAEALNLLHSWRPEGVEYRVKRTRFKKTDPITGIVFDWYVSARKVKS